MGSLLWLEKLYEKAKHTAELIANDLLPPLKANDLKVLSETLFVLGGNIY